MAHLVVPQSTGIVVAVVKTGVMPVDIMMVSKLFEM